MVALGLDVGSRTIGVAASDPGRVVATPREVLARRGTAADVGAVVDLVDRHAAQDVVIGHPLELDGRAGHRAKRVEGFAADLRAELLRRELPVGVHLWDERFSTVGAEQAMRDADVAPRRRRELVDALAAQLVLQNWLDARQPRGEDP
jgi:putative Holliday junction resolvase